MGYTPPPRPRSGRWIITVRYLDNTYRYPVRSTSEAGARLRALRQLARDLGEPVPLVHAHITEAVPV